MRPRPPDTRHPRGSGQHDALGALHVLVLFRAGPAIAERELHAHDHTAFVESLIRRNTILLGGDFGDVFEGFHVAYLLRCESVDEARAIAADDPFFGRGVFEPVLSEWELVGVNVEAIPPAPVVTPGDV